MPNIHLVSVTSDELIDKLLKFYDRMDNLLSLKLTEIDWKDPRERAGAKGAIEGMLRALVLTDLVPLIGPVQWDEQIHIPPIYSSSSITIMDLVDGANEYLREGANVTSHMGIYSRDDGHMGSLQLGIVSYPFHRFRVVAIGEGQDSSVHRLPLEFGIRPGETHAKLETSKLKPVALKQKIGDLAVIDRYELGGAVRERLNRLRDEWTQNAGYIVERGSVAKTIVDVALGAYDVAIRGRTKQMPPHDYLTPSKVLENAGGVFRTLTGAKPDGVNAIDGFIAAANQKAYDLFVDGVMR